MNSREEKPGQPDAPRLGEPPVDEAWENRANWKLGLFYYAPDDPRVWVPKRSTMGRRRLGVTPNMARPEARRYLGYTIAGFGVLFCVLWVLDRCSN